MKATLLTKNRHTTGRAAALAQIGQTGPFLEGHLSAFKRPGCAQPGWHLTFKQQGKTRTVYVRHSASADNLKRSPMACVSRKVQCED